ncbi:hypothetical protein [Salidesulfovibrio brasiliensis]|uniref:hypothetical protein n=1 Tax=Salidesulfovibrio brasiliensis TaxID=221711 RepID=UPI001FE081CC|nr:hypothetical protein [Salidesulfovibrio brasiliensis]
MFHCVGIDVLEILEIEQIGRALDVEIAQVLLLTAGKDQYGVGIELARGNDSGEGIEVCVGMSVMTVRACIFGVFFFI